MTREEILAKLTDLLGEEQAGSVADALIGAEAPPETEESAPETEAPASESEAPEPEPESEPAPEPESSEPEMPELESETPESEPEPSAPEPEPSEPEAPVPEPAPSEPDPTEALRAENNRLRERLTHAALRLSALALGVAPERVDVVGKLAELGEFDPESEQAAAQAEEAVRRVLEQVPELAGRALPAIGSIGAHPREGTRPVDPFEKGFFR